MGGLLGQVELVNDVELVVLLDDLGTGAIRAARRYAQRLLLVDVVGEVAECLSQSQLGD